MKDLLIFTVFVTLKLLCNAQTVTDIDSKIIYPNPANDRLYIKYDNFSAFVMIFDLQGRQVFNRQIGSDFIDISNLSEGIYLVKVVDAGNIIVNKLIKY